LSDGSFFIVYLYDSFILELRQVQSRSGGSSTEIEKLKKSLEEEKLKKIQVGSDRDVKAPIMLHHFVPVKI
jgi:hypothetical protein